LAGKHNERSRSILKKHGFKPAWDNYVPDQSEYQIKKKLKEIYKNYKVDI